MGTETESAQFALPAAAPPPRALRIAFVATCLDTGGAEVMLWKLLSRIDRARFDPCVIALSGEQTSMVPAFRALGLDCEVLAWRKAREPLGGIRRLAKTLRARDPDIVQGWMYHGNVAATLGAAWARLDAPVLWNIRASLMERRFEKRLTRLLIRLGGKLSSTPAAIVNNSEASAVQHETLMGYDPRNRVVLPNGFDTDKFRPSASIRGALRDALAVDSDALLVGLVARYHPMKGHALFLRAAAIVSRDQPLAQYVLVGEGVDADNPELGRLIQEYGLEGRVHLLGVRDDMHAITPALDVLVCASSSGEGFPNVLGEAMCCAVPCVATDVGDSAAIVGDTGIVVPAGDAEALAKGILTLTAIGRAGREELGERARRRAIEQFSLNAIVRRYENLYSSVHRQRKGK
jgi:glycosyltransferase involved in cell wall biosynthesis